MLKKYRMQVKCGTLVVCYLVIYYKMLTDPVHEYWGPILALCLGVNGLKLMISGGHLPRFWPKTLSDLNLFKKARGQGSPLSKGRL